MRMQRDLFIEINRPFRGYGIVLVLFIVFVALRMIFLDRDLPPFDIFNYQPIDEFWYNNTAFNLYHYTDAKHRIVPYVESDSITPNLFGNLVSWFTLLLFGNNYYGLRSAPVLMSICFFILFFFTLRRYCFSQEPVSEKKDSRSVNLWILAVLAYLVVDFSFVLASRVSEPTIFRIFSFAVVMFFFTGRFAERNLAKKWFCVLAGIIAFATVFYVYPNNLFLVPATWAFCVFAQKPSNIPSFISRSLLFLVGGLLCFVSYEIILRLVFGKSYIDQLVAYSVFAGRVNLPGAETAGGGLAVIKKFLYNIFGYFSTNIFRLNPLLLLLFLTSLPIFTFRLIQKKYKKDILLAVVVLFFFLQTIFINDYFYRKLIFLLPMVMLVITVAIKNAILFLDWIKAERTHKIAMVIYCVFALFFTVLIFLVNCYKPLIGKDVILDQKYIIFPLFVLQLVLIGILIRKKISKLLLAATLAVVLLPGLYMNFRYILSNVTYSYRDAMNSLSGYVNDRIVVGGLANGFRLYNTYKPVLDVYGYKFTAEGIKQYPILRDKIIAEGLAEYTILMDGDGPNFFYSGHDIYKDKMEKVFMFNLRHGTEVNNERIGLYRYKSEIVQ